MSLPNLHTPPKRQLIKIRAFQEKRFVCKKIEVRNMS